ncbi:asparagine synthase (glutamine-hydrolyzing) [Thalassomonas viridans]|uniref:asparagine synthase (glutamine-hydrolyzing) n=1 Tax=Thalassomonas viridans TaxID=137584 RepID=A0AAF0C863_9GAMM|nr:asparagine synthase (glutamine-hydrolyzing) [Thalassomonas viridans]WDE06072.1 asparagine synthase (glutamine-hydrolyzing) [Thalassomonas viridans]
MCGFIGVYRTDNTSVIHQAALADSLDEINHRGPDEKNIWMDDKGRAALGHTRLSIIGLDNGLQPISAEGGQLQIVVNGEFYDFEKIRAELQQKGYVFSTSSDSEIALHLYREYGIPGLERLRGEFSLVLYNGHQNTMILMRDRLGIKPLYYAQHEGALYVGSEIKALLAAGVPAIWDEDAYTSRGFYLRDRSLFKGVNSVPPGHQLFITPGGIKQNCYWDIEYSSAEELDQNNYSEADLVGQVHDAIKESVSLRLRSDVPMAVYLSGGIDSSAMLGMASHLSGTKMDAFNLSFTDMNDYDENRFARLAAEQNGARFHTIPVTQDDLADNFTRALWHNETPFFNAHGVAKYMLSGSVRDAGFKVVLTGEGADEVFAGYPHFRRDMILFNNQNQDAQLITSLTEKLQQSEAGYSRPDMPEDINWMLKQLGHGVSWLDNQAGWFKALEKMYNSDTRQQFANTAPYQQFYNQLDHRRLTGLDPVHRSMYLWAKSYLPNFVLTTLGDRMEMANSIEGRVPLLDHRVVELAARMPVSVKVKGSTEKYIFREAMKPYLPEDLYKRKKHYFRAPPATLMQKGKLYQLVQDTLRSKQLEMLPFFDAAKVRSLLDSLPQMTRNEQALIDPMLMELTSLCLLQQQFSIGTDAKFSNKVAA